MKKIEAIIRPSKLEPIKNTFIKTSIHGMTISQVQGCGNQHGWKEYYRGSEVILNMLPKIKLEIVTADDQVDTIIDIITGIAQTGEVGDGKIFISTIDECIRIRTGERGQAAL
jgi:nitrogen regulatory protein P-II 1